MGRLPPQWQKLPVSLAELCIDTTLRCGQSFRWRKINDEWRCSLHGRVVSLKQDADYVYFRATFPEKPAHSPAAPLSHALAAQTKAASERQRETAAVDDDTEALLRSYFNLQLDLRALYVQWSRDDPNFRRKAPKFSGIRILNQDAWEALVCFICSSNNNIARISQMAHKLCLHYGPFLGTLDGEPYHDFPSPKALAAPSVESHLRQLGFGYRAKYIAQTAQTIAADKPPGWLLQLRNATCPPWPGTTTSTGRLLTASTEASSYKAAHEQLVLLSGVGPKVADCVCLMGLGWGEAVPVDTHVWQIAVRDYKFKKSGGAGASKTFSKAMYDAVGDHFRGLWGAQAGWAQSVLFTANLRTFSERLKAEDTEEVSATPESAADKKRRKVARQFAKEDVKVAAAELVVERARKRRKRA